MDENDERHLKLAKEFHEKIITKTYSIRINFNEGIGEALKKIDEMKAKIIQTFPAVTNLGDAILLKMIEERQNDTNYQVEIVLLDKMTFLETLCNGSRPGPSFTAKTESNYISSGCKIEQVGEEKNYNYPTTDDTYEHYKVTIKEAFRNSATFIIFSESYQSWDEHEENVMTIYTLNKKLYNMLLIFCKWAVVDFREMVLRK